MKKLCTILLFIMVSLSLSAQSVIFLHHSTGAGVYDDGIGLPQWITNYNTTHSTNYQISESWYPTTPYPDNNYAYDYWNLWVNPGQCDNTQSGIRCFDYFTSHYNVIIFKHCFPGAGIEEDTGSPGISSETKSIENYKLQYRALRALMDNYPNNKFIVWTLAPLHRNATDAATAARARQFVNWVKNEWLTEGGSTHNNIHIFDFYGYAAESDPTPANGKVNCLKYEYEGSHTGDDSHPNGTANDYIMPIFGQFIVDVIQNNPTGINNLSGLENLKVKFYPNPTQNCLKIDGVEKLESVEILGLNGNIVQKHIQPTNEINISSLPKGTYIVRAGKNSKFKSQFIVVD